MPLFKLLTPHHSIHDELYSFPPCQTPSDYTEQPGGHPWDYWPNSLPNHMSFFSTVLKANSAAAPYTTLKFLVAPYLEQPGTYTWEDRINGLFYQLVFLDKILKIHHLTVP